MPIQCDELKAAPYNPRKISKAQFAALGKAMKEFGDLGGIVWNKRTGNLIGGHQRLKALGKSFGIQDLVPAKDSQGTVAVGYIRNAHERWAYREVDWPIEKEKAANVAANAHGGEFDLDLLKPLVAELKISGLDLDLTGLDASVLNKLSNGATSSEADDYQPKCRPDPITKTGDLYALGNHRLLCGDARNGEDVAKLMSTDVAHMMWTDPPYGVSYVGKTKAAKTIQNDSAWDLPNLLGTSFAAAHYALCEGAAIYIAHPPGALSVEFGKAFLAAGWRLHETLIWVKDSMVLGHSDYHIKHEPILFGYKAGGGRRGRGGEGWYGGDAETSVLEYPRPKASEDHPTMKPVALVERMVRNSSPSRGIVYDPFSGSGSTLMACEASGRMCRAIELDPVYCDVIVHRWELETGHRATVTRQNEE